MLDVVFLVQKLALAGSLHLFRRVDVELCSLWEGGKEDQINQ